MTRDVDLFVIGGGSGGVRAARIAANHGARVAIAEEYRYGGTCVIRGCVPKKYFVFASEFSQLFEDAASYGWDVKSSFDWKTLRDNKDAAIDRLNGIYIRLLKTAGVTIHNGRATLLDAHTVRVGDDVVSAEKILIATGATPTRPEIPGARLGITSNEAFHLSALPRRITLVGGGYIGLEFATIFHGLGCDVSLVHHRDKVLRGFDHAVREQVTGNLERQGIKLFLDDEIQSIEKHGEELSYVCRSGKANSTEMVMFTTGRHANTAGMGLEAAGVALGERGEIIVDNRSRTNVDNIYAVGDCTDRLQLTPIAIREGQAFADQVFGSGGSDVEYTMVPTAIFCHPPVATVGITEEEARAQGPVTIYRSEFRALFLSMTRRQERVMMKLVVRDSDRVVVGAHLVGQDAPEIVQALAVAMRMGATKEDFDRTVALHPTTAEELVLMRNPV